MKLPAILAASAALLRAQDPLLDEARARILQAIRNMPRYTCTQTIDRSRFIDTTGPTRRGDCDQLLANRRNGLSHGQLTETDRLRLDVLNSDEGVEVYSWPGAGRISVERIQDLAGEGDIGTGTFGPFLINIFTAEGVQFVPEGAADGLVRYRYRVPEKSSHYRVEVAGSARIVPFDGRFWIDAATFDLRRLTVRTGELTATTGHCEASTSIDFTRTHIGSGDYLLPRESVLETLRRDGAESRNVTRYAACREFAGESTLRFDVPDETSGPAANASAAPFPAGVRFTVVLLDDIDTANAAAGDPVRARVIKVSRGSALPPGAVIHGRLVHLTHHLSEHPEFAIAIVFERLEAGGRSQPFAAIPDRPMVLTDTTTVARITPNTVQVWTTGRRSGTRGGAFVFHSPDPNIVVPHGAESQWISIAPPK